MVSVAGRCIDEPIFSSSLLFAFVYAMLILNSEHTYNRHNRGEGRGDN